MNSTVITWPSGLPFEYEGALPAFINGYPVIYLTRRNNVLCATCADANEDDDDPTATVGPFWEGAPLDCDECSATIESAYGDPNEGGDDNE